MKNKQERASLNPRILTFLGSVFLIVLCLFVPLAHSAPVNSANADEEKELIAVLRSDVGPRKKDEACARLKRIGKERSIPALAALLTDEKLSHSARYALESMQTPAGGKALVSALRHTSGSLEVGIIDSIGVRAEKSADSTLVKCLNDSDPAVASAAAAALGKIGDETAFKGLLAAMRNSDGETHSAQVRACLACAQAQLLIGRAEQARAAFDLIYRTEPGPGMKLAAYRGLIYSSGRQSRNLIVKALTGDPGPAQTAALQVLHEHDFGIVPDLLMVMTDLSPSVLRAILDGLTEAENPASVELARACMPSESVDVRVAAIRCLGALGDIAAIPLLEKPAAYASGAEKEAAQSALVRLHHGMVSAGLLAQLRTADAPIKAEAARALGQRGDTNAVPALLESAAGDPDVVRVADLEAIGLLGQAKDIDAVVGLVVRAKSNEARSAATEALNSMLQRPVPVFDSASLSNAVTRGPSDARIALIEDCVSIKSPQIRGALRFAARDQDPKVRDAAVRAICESSDIELLPDLLQFATDKNDEKVRSLAINGCVRLLTQEEQAKVATSVKVDAFKRILAGSPNDAEKRTVLSGLSRIPDAESLNLADSLLDDQAVQAEAIQAVISIARSLPSGDRAAAKPSLDKILGLQIDAETRQSASALRDKLNTEH